MTKEESQLEELKKKYSEFKEKYDLPEFEEINKDFHVEKLADQETDLLHWEIKRLAGDKLSNYMRFIENLLNPTNVPMFIFSIVKVLTAEEKKKLSETYRKLMRNEIKFIQSDLEVSEERDAKFIKESHKLWKSVSKDLGSVIDKIESKWDSSKIEPTNKGYFG